MKDSFLLHHDTLSVINELTDEQAGQLIKEILQHSLFISNPTKAKKPSGLNGLMNSVLYPFKMQLDRDLEKYSKKCKSNAENGKKGGRPPKEETQTKPSKANKADNDKDNDKDKDIKGKKLPLKKPKGFVYSDIFENLWKLYKHNIKGDKWNGYVSAKKRLDEGYEIEALRNIIMLENNKEFAKRHFATIMNGDIDIEKQEIQNKKANVCL